MTEQHMEPTTERCDRCDQPAKAHVYVDGDCGLQHRYTNRTHPPRAMIGHCCRWCVERQETTVTEVADLYATLHTVLLVDDMPTEDYEHQKPRKAPASPSPLRLDAWAMLHDRDRLLTATRDRDGNWEPAYLGGNLPDVPAVLCAWAGWAMEAAGQTDSPPNTVTTAAIKLRALSETIACQPDVDEYDAELRWVHRSLQRAHGISQPKRLGQCLTVADGKECGGSVWPDPAGGNPKCARCRRVYGHLDLVRLRITEEGQAS